MTTMEHLDVLRQAMMLATLPWGLIKFPGLQLDCANKALQMQMRSGPLQTGLDPVRHPLLLQALHNSVQLLAETTVQLPQQSMQWHFVPMQQDGQVCAVQCYLTAAPLTETQSSTARSGELAHSDRFEALLDLLPYQAWIATPHGELTWLNKALKLYAYNHAQPIDLSDAVWIDIVHPHDLAGVNAGLSRALITEKATGYRLRIKKHGGGYEWFYATLAPVKNASNETLYWVGSNISIQTLKQAEDKSQDQITRLKHQLQLGRQELALSQASLARAQKMDLISNLSAGVAHDLNNLLFITGLHAGLLEKKITDNQQHEHIDVIHETIKKAGRLASQLTGFSSRKSMTLVTADPKTLIRDIEQLLYKAVGDEAQLQIQLAAKLWPIRVDRMYFENSLINLAINARDATAGGGNITLTVENAVLKRQDFAGDYLMISLRDDGIGMSEAVQARIFELLFTTKPEGKGAGLGLPMVKNFMDHSHGLIEVESAEGQGSCFRLYFPRSEQDSSPKDEPQALEQGGRETILLIEQDLPTRNAMAQVLYELDYQVATAYKPEVALRYINSGLKVNLIIASARQQKPLSAIQLCHQLRNEGLHIPLLVTTGKSHEELRSEQPATEEFTVLIKPVSMPDLSKAVHALLHRSPAAEQLGD
ncbi:PAS domain-containing hybrid sensor histidine kinase/response regulator [Comamonas aquatilis]|uniref:ATP-binding protein n=1 Tax=Comamonas aquatilis TaxID=1778406 RepID=UPI0039F0F812